MIAVALLLPGCDDPAPAPPPVASIHVDEVDPHALPEGTLEMFGIRFPAQSVATTTMSDYGVVRVPFQAERVANYVRQRIDFASVEVGPTSTIYTGVVPKASPALGPFTIIVRRQTFSAEVILRMDPTAALGRPILTPPPDPNAPPPQLVVPKSDPTLIEPTVSAAPRRPRGSN